MGKRYVVKAGTDYMFLSTVGSDSGSWYPEWTPEQKYAYVFHEGISEHEAREFVKDRPGTRVVTLVPGRYVIKDLDETNGNLEYWAVGGLRWSDQKRALKFSSARDANLVVAASGCPGMAVFRLTKPKSA